MKGLDLSNIQSHFRYAVLDSDKALAEDAMVIRREHQWVSERQKSAPIKR